MIDFTMEITDRGVRAHLDRLPIAVKAKLLPTIEAITKRLLIGVRAAEPMKTGALRAATRSYVDSGEDFIRGKVKIGAVPGRGNIRSMGRWSPHNVAAAALEYGVNSTFTVRAHGERLRSGGFSMVREHQRRVEISARRFLRGPFETMRPIAEAEIRRALAEVKA